MRTDIEGRTDFFFLGEYLIAKSSTRLDLSSSVQFTGAYRRRAKEVYMTEVVYCNTLLFFLQGARCEEHGPDRTDHGKYTTIGSTTMTF